MAIVGAGWVADLLWELGRKLEKHRRKRAPGDEDHWFPKYPKQNGLLPHQCYFCHEILADEPKRGCKGLATRG